MTTPLVLNVSDFGAVGNGIADDTDAIQATIDALPSAGGAVGLPPGNFRTTRTLNLLRSGTAFSPCFRGASTYSSLITWDGPSDGTAVLARHLIGFEIADLSIINKGTRGSTVGVQLASDAVGSDTGPGLIKNLHIMGFHEGWSVGDAAGHAASEITYINFTVHNCDTGVAIRASNSLNHVFYQLATNGCSTGMDVFNSDAVNIYGGSAANNSVIDFLFRSSGQFGISGFRSEGANRFIAFGAAAGGGAWSPSTVVLNGIEIYHTKAADGRAICLGKMGHYTIQGCNMRGHVYLASVGALSSLNLIGNAVDDSVRAGAPNPNPVLIENSAPECSWDVTSRGNTNSMNGLIGAGGAYWLNEHYKLLPGVGRVDLR